MLQKTEKSPLHTNSLFKKIDESNLIIIKIYNIKHAQRVPTIDSEGFTYETLLSFANSTIPLNEIPYPLIESSDLRKYEIQFIYCNEGKEIQLSLPEEMNKNLLHFIGGGRRWGEGCMDLINDLNFCCNQQKLNFINCSIDDLKDEKDLSAGDAIIIGNTEKKGFAGKHFAVYLGCNLYLSIMGNNHPLYVTSLEGMKKIYDCKETYRCVVYLNNPQLLSMGTSKF